MNNTLDFLHIYTQLYLTLVPVSTYATAAITKPSFLFLSFEVKTKKLVTVQSKAVTLSFPVQESLQD